MHGSVRSRFQILPMFLLCALACVALPARLKAQGPGQIRPDSLRRAVITKMKQGLRGMLATESEQYDRNWSFAINVSAATSAEALPYHLEVTAADARGWTAVATATAEPALHCGIFVGAGVAPNAAVLAPTVPACWRVVDDSTMVTE